MSGDRTPAGAGEDGETDGADSDRPTVLAVDDEQRVGEAFALWLDDYRVLTATSGREALDAMSETVDVVLLDRHMPGLSGDEVLERLREAEYDCRVAMVTAVDPDFDIVEMPFDEYVPKPVDRDELRETVEGLLELSNYDQHLAELYRVNQKLATLSVEKSEARLADSEEYAALEDRQAELQNELSEIMETMDGEEIGTLFDPPGP